MIRWLVALFLMIPALAAAQTARVVSGEHKDFTRLVVQLPAPSDWTVGRLPLGYGFAVQGTGQPNFDLTSVWDRIPRTRLQSIRVDAGTGALQLVLACDCHVFPFEYRPGMIVLDIKEGPPSTGSAFETVLDPTTLKGAPDLAMAGDDRPNDSSASYNWLDELASPDPARPDAAQPLDLATGAVSLDPLRDQLLAQISRGAANGVVDMELPEKPPRVLAEDDSLQWGELPWTRIRIGESDGVEVRPGGSDAIAGTEAKCVTDAELDVAAWGQGAAPADLLATGRNGLFGEFDLLEPDAVLRAVQVHLSLGFGAEARVYGDLIEVPSELDRVYRSLSYLVDGETHPETPFSDMLGCDTAAALWAALARDRLPPGPEVNVDSILRAFLALPPHLRRHLGPGLAERFLARKDAEAARVVRDALQRTPDVASAEVDLLSAKADLQGGDVEAARTHAASAVSERGDDIEGLLTLVETHARDETPLPAEIAETLHSLMGEVEGGPDEGGVVKAYALALMLSGQTQAALDAAADAGTAADVWRLVPGRADEDDFLRHAILPGHGLPPPVDPETQEAIASRLLAAGFGDAALRWLGPVGPASSQDRRVLAADAELARGDARAASVLLEGLEGPDAAALRAEAQIQLGSYAAAKASLPAGEAGAEAARLATWEEDWTQVASSGPEAWANAARILDPAPVPVDLGPLGKGQALLAESAAMRAALDTLLSSVPPPQ